MFRFKALELMNWDCYPHYRTPMDGEIILLIGQNGSGKTTFLDALRVLLNGTRLSKSRTLHHYVQKDVEVAMIKAVVTNDLMGDRRTFSHLGIHTNSDVSLICLIKNKGPQRIEKEFFIAKGDIPIENISKMRGGFKPLQYSRHLEDAGVSRSTLKLIALEQGQTDRIGQLSAKDLLQLVMDITGNKDIIKRYEEARQNYRRSSQQLIELRTEYNKIAHQMHDLEKQAREAEAYKRLMEEENAIRIEKLPLARWYQIINQHHDLEKKHQDFQEKKAQLEKKQRAIREGQEKIKAKREILVKEQQELKNKETEEERELNKLYQKIGECNSEWQSLDNLRKACEEMTDVSSKELQKQLDKYQAQYYQKKMDLAQCKEKISNWKKEMSSLSKSSLPTYPSEVYAFREVLQKRDINHLVLAECIEIKDPHWQLAIEAHLGRERFTVFVSTEDFLDTKKLGERDRYGFYITSFEKAKLSENIPDNSILANIKILDKRISARLANLDRILLVETVEEGHKHNKDITITASGYRQDKRGGIFIARDIRFYCGGLAAEQQKEEIKQGTLETLELQKQLESEQREVSKKIKEQKKQIEYFNQKEQWAKSQERYKHLEQHGQELLKSSEELSQKRFKTKDEIEIQAKELSRNFTEYQEQEKDYNKTQRELSQITDALLENEQRLGQLRWQKGELEKNISSDAKNSYNAEEIEDVDWLEHKLREIVLKKDNFQGCKELEKISLYNHETIQLEKKHLQLQRQENDQQLRSKELELCRKDYREMIEDTITFYNKAIKDLAQLAGCRMRAILYLGREEALVEEAKLNIRVSFDQKKEVDIHDKSLSGGQDVIASLILLVALSRMEQEQASGFFIMDEHNAHLDMMRIMQVGHFLRSTQAQFVLTTPTTENTATMAVADLILTFTKKSANTKYASKPRYIRRM